MSYSKGYVDFGRRPVGLDDGLVERNEHRLVERDLALHQFRARNLPPHKPDLVIRLSIIRR